LSDPDTLFETLRREAGEQICGPALYLHHSGSSEIECCYPVMGAVESELVHSQRLPGCEVLSLVHCGPCSGLGESWEMLFDYIERNNIPVAGPWREIYLDDRAGKEGYQRIELQAPLLKDRANGQ
jgi:effector-binding domain-containing protein